MPSFRREIVEQSSGKIVNGQISPEDVHLLGVGFSTVKNDKYLEVKEYRINPGDLMATEAENFMRSISQWDEEFRKFPKKLVSKSPYVFLRSEIEARTAGSLIRPNVESRLSSLMCDSPMTRSDFWPKALVEHDIMMNALSQAYAQGFTTDAIERRAQIANLRPDMNPEENRKKK